MAARLIKKAIFTVCLLVGIEIVYALFRPVPDLEEFDPSGEFGDPDLPPLRVVVLGDSSVTAPGTNGPEESWVQLVGRGLGSTRHVILESLAVGGSCADDLITDQLPAALRFEPDLALVSVGANDAIRGVPLRRFEENLGYLVETLVSSGALVVLSGVGDLGTIPRLYPPLRQALSRRSARFDAAHWRVAMAHGAHVVPHREFDPAAWYSDRGLWSEDLFHVSAAGHRRWASTALATLEPLLASADATV